MAYEGDSIDLGYPGINSRRGRVGHEIAHTLTTGNQQGTLHFVDISPPPLVTDVARCLNTRQDSSIHNHRGESRGAGGRTAKGSADTGQGKKSARMEEG